MILTTLDGSSSAPAGSTTAIDMSAANVAASSITFCNFVTFISSVKRSCARESARGRAIDTAPLLTYH